MPRSRLALSLLLVCLTPGPAVAADADEDPEESAEEQQLRQRLTEREDRRRPRDPLAVDVGGRPLVISGELETILAGLRPRVLGEPARQRDRLLLEQGIEVELFYGFGPQLSLFAQLRPTWEEDLLPHTDEDLSDVFVERGEMWLYSEPIPDVPLSFDVGRLHFEDERRWWWDEDLDAVRVQLETGDVAWSAAVAQELGPDRSDRHRVDPEQAGVLRLIGQASWEWHRDHLLEVFVLHAHDRSRRQGVGAIVRRSRLDPSDATLSWLGARALGVVEVGRHGIVGYWLDAAAVTGRETLLAVDEEVAPGAVVEVVRRDVEGFATDVGLSWILPWRSAPRVFAGYAFGSGDPNPERGGDHAFRQTGLQNNEAGFGGVERFTAYGVILDPELSNLHVVTLGVGLELLRSSSLDLVFHHYRLHEPAPELRDAQLEAALTGTRRDLGQGLDLVLALEEWEHLEMDVAAGVFRAGTAFGPDAGRWSFGGHLALRYAF